MASKDKKYEEIPIVSHKSEKPCIIFEEVGSGKLYASNYSFLSSCKENKPISIHDSQKPSLVFEEINSVVVPNFQE